MREGERPREEVGVVLGCEEQESIAAKVRDTLESIEAKADQITHAPPPKKRKRIWGVCWKQKSRVFAGNRGLESVLEAGLKSVLETEDSSMCWKQRIVQLERSLKPLAALSLQLLYTSTPPDSAHSSAFSSTPEAPQSSPCVRRTPAPPPCALHFTAGCTPTVGVGVELRHQRRNVLLMKGKR